MQIVIRQAKTSDLDRIIEIEKDCFPLAEAATAIQLKNRLKAFEHSFLVAEKADEIVGFVNGCVTQKRRLVDELYASTKLHDDAAPNQMIFGLAVAPEEQHQGIASLLMNDFIIRAKKRRKKRITLTCKEHLIPFYEQFGYKNEGESTSVHGGVRWNDMTLFLEVE
jgi:predicted N-acetyltransferase YhbS